MYLGERVIDPLVGLHTVVPSSKGPDGASILGQRDRVGTSTRHLANVANVFNQSWDVSAVAVSMT